MMVPRNEINTFIDAPGHQGIDGIYKCDSPPPEYIVVEAKYRTDGKSAAMSVLKDGTVQMSDDWIMDSKRIGEYFGSTSAGMAELRNFQRAWVNGQVQKEVSAITPNGSVTRTIIE